MIYTFYSYKGGVGRSMMVVNIAELMYQAGLRVLIIDWDLEAPGIERFFPEQAETILKNDGLVDMLVNYKVRLQSIDPDSDSIFPIYENLDNYFVDLHPNELASASEQKLQVLSAGRRYNRFREYAQQVTEFDWKDFYDNWEGETYFEWFRHELETQFDIILIDSRTGVTEMGGVCTYQLANVVTLVTVPSQQSLDGTLEMVEQLNRPEVQQIRNEADQPLQTVVIPGRVERSTETFVLNEFRAEFKKRFAGYIPEEFKAATYQLEIPYIPFYTFGEQIAVHPAVRSSNYRSVDLEHAYMTLLRVLANISFTPKAIKDKLLDFLSKDYVDLAPAYTGIIKDVIASHESIIQLENLVEESERSFQRLEQEFNEVQDPLNKQKLKVDKLRQDKELQERKAELEQLQDDYHSKLPRLNYQLIEAYAGLDNTQHHTNNRLASLSRQVAELKIKLNEAEKLTLLLQQLKEEKLTQTEALQTLNNRVDELEAQKNNTEKTNRELEEQINHRDKLKKYGSLLLGTILVGIVFTLYFLLDEILSCLGL